jgi:phospholipid transport system substrate-binding protein
MFRPLPQFAAQMRRVLDLCALLVLLAGAGALSARAAPDAGAVLAELADRAIKELTEPDLSAAEQERRFRALINEGFDIPGIGRFVLGRYWQGATEAERTDFLATYEDMMIQRFLPVFGQYSGERVQVGAVRPFADGTGLVNVTSLIVRNEGEPVRVDWRMRLVDDRYKIFDIIAEGVSIGVTLRSEYTTVLKNNGGNVTALTQLLRSKIHGS